MRMGLIMGEKRIFVYFKLVLNSSTNFGSMATKKIEF